MDMEMMRRDVEMEGMVTFGTPGKARLMAEFASVKELERIARTPAFRDRQLMVIGGGSNLVFRGEFDGLLLHSTIKGITEYVKNDDERYVIAGSGERWADLVDWTIEHGYSGLECMAGIPGDVGAAPVQNVGAFGAEAKDAIFSVECFDAETKKLLKVSNEECRFGYRDSRFKHDWKNRYIVTRVSFKLKKSERAENLTYKSLREWAEGLDHAPTPQEVRDEVLRLRATKVPTPPSLAEESNIPQGDILGSAGSFFKNPIVHKNYFEDEVKRRHAETPAYEVDYRRVKIPAGWLIEHAGLKGLRRGGAEVYEKNCLVICNRGDATADDVKELAETVEREVRGQFGVRLEPEVNIVDTGVKVTILGTGTSKGVPEIGCDCETCRSEDPRDKRLRSSVLVETMGERLLIDASPDFRQQAMAAGIHHIDALLLTHVHYDHVGGMDDLRPFCLNGDIPVYCRQDVADDLKRRIDYCFRSDKYPGVPGFDTHIITDRPFTAAGVRVTPISVNHGNLPIVGYRIGDFGYITDCKSLEDSEKEKLKGLKVLIINALRERDHFAHLTIEEAVKLIGELKPERALLTHLCHEAGTHAALAARLPEGVEPAWDGEVVNA